jgi:hypothetical protein
MIICGISVDNFYYDNIDNIINNRFQRTLILQSSLLIITHWTAAFAKELRALHSTPLDMQGT